MTSRLEYAGCVGMIWPATTSNPWGREWRMLNSLTHLGSLHSGPWINCIDCTKYSSLSVHGSIHRHTSSVHPVLYFAITVNQASMLHNT
jgi:hypothetical protein